MFEDNSSNNCPKGDTSDSLAAMRGDLLLYALSRVGDTELAEELVQDAYVKYLNVANKEAIENPKGYIVRIIFNLSVSYYRKKRIRAVDTEAEADPESQPGAESSPEEWIRYRQLKTRFEKAYASLSQRQREIFYLRRMDGLSTDEIANRFGISKRMIQKHLAQIIKHIHQQISDV